MDFFSYIYDIIVFMGATVIGIGGAFLITSNFVYAVPLHNDLRDEEEIDFEDTYREEFDQLETKERPPDDVIADYVSSVDTPIGEVVITYDVEMNTFYYYCDRRTVPIRFLDVAAQKFVIDNDCKILYEEKPLEDDTDEEEEEQSADLELQNQSYYNWITGYFSREAPAEVIAEAKSQTEASAEAEDEAEEESSVFASYKKKPEINVQKAKQIEKIMNRYKYCGTLRDYYDNKEKVEQEALNISYDKFKEMVKNKTE